MRRYTCHACARYTPCWSLSTDGDTSLEERHATLHASTCSAGQVLAPQAGTCSASKVNASRSPFFSPAPRRGAAPLGALQSKAHRALLCKGLRPPASQGSFAPLGPAELLYVGESRHLVLRHKLVNARARACWARRRRRPQKKGHAQHTTCLPSQKEVFWGPQRVLIPKCHVGPSACVHLVQMERPLVSCPSVYLHCFPYVQEDSLVVGEQESTRMRAYWCTTHAHEPSKRVISSSSKTRPLLGCSC